MKISRILVVLMLLFTLGMLSGCAGNADKSKSTPTPSATPASTMKSEATTAPTTGASTDTDSDLAAKEENKVNIKIEMQDGGVIKAELYPDIAPITVENFVKLVNEHFYDGLIFHRVISGFMIQGGGYDANYQQKQADSIKGEFASNGVQNDLKHTRGVLSMARTMVKDSASSQFFIMHQDAPHLDGDYAAFGKVTEGMDVVDKIASTKTGAQDMPVEPQVIKTITIEE